MTNLYTSGLIVPAEDPVEVQIDRVSIDSQITLTVTKHSAADELIGEIVPPVTYVENSIVDKTRIRVFLNEGQLEAGEKLQIKLDN